jgi:VWFA-related protein
MNLRLLRLAVVCGGALVCAQAARAGALLSAAELVSGEPAGAAAFAGISADSGLYADGTRAIHEGRWAEAVNLFGKVASQRGEHADGAIYWQAYAQNKLGEAKVALKSCRQLRSEFPQSRWIEDCGALEVEIHSSLGKPMAPQLVESDDVRLLALNARMKQDEASTLIEIRQLLESARSERLKEKLLFLLAESKSAPARQLLTEVKEGKVGAAAAGLRARATRLLRELAETGKPTLDPVEELLTLDVVVTDKTGQPVSGLKAEDFTLLDNQRTQKISFFKPVSGLGVKGDQPVEVVLLVDAVNAHFATVANERQWLSSFFSANGGKLALPTSLALLTDQGVQVQNAPTREGSKLAALLDSSPTGLRVIDNAQGIYGELDRRMISLKAIHWLTADLSRRPGRKLVIWVSPGWADLSTATYSLSEKDATRLFAEIVRFSTAMREADITLYSVDPDGAQIDSRPYELFLKGVSNPHHADFGDLMLQVLALQSGGKVMLGSNDTADLVDQCINDARSYYRLTYAPPPAARPNEYHSLEVRVNQPNLKARTRTGYYAQPQIDLDAASSDTAAAQ